MNNQFHYPIDNCQKDYLDIRQFYRSVMVKIQFDSRLLSNALPENFAAEKTSENTIILEVPAGKSVNEILKDLNLNLSQAVAAVVNGRSTDLEQPLEPGDQVRLLPQIAGGD